MLFNSWCCDRYWDHHHRQKTFESGSATILRPGLFSICASRSCKDFLVAGHLYHALFRASFTGLFLARSFRWQLQEGIFDRDWGGALCLKWQQSFNASSGHPVTCVIEPSIWLSKTWRLNSSCFFMNIISFSCDSDFTERLLRPLMKKHSVS